MCHTLRSAVGSAGDGSGAWRCTRCGQQWDADRVLAVAAYAAWSREHDAVRHGAVNPSYGGSAAATPERTP
jgi:transposase